MSQPRASHCRLTRSVAACLSVNLAALVGCTQDPTGSGTGGLPRSPALVSAPDLAVSGGTAGLGLGFAYISMRPGTDPAGVSVTVRNRQVGLPVDAAMADGGFDPIAIAAETDDTLLITVHHSDGNSTAGYAVVQARTRPVVVRTSPPHGKTDVVLNSVITIIFTQPMDSVSLPGALRLSHGGTGDAGTVTVSASALSAAFVPTGSLAPETAYQFEVSTAAQSQDGEALVAPVEVDFTTGSDTAAVATVSISPSPLQVVVGGQQHMSAVPLNATGTPLTTSCTWGTSDTAVATISSTGLLSALALGTAVIRATCSGAFGEATVTVVPVPLNLVFASVSAGYIHNCGVTTAGVAYCWGNNSTGQLGDGNVYVASTTPVAVAGELNFASVSASAWHTCGLTTSGAAYCWGSGWSGLGESLGIPAGTPVPVPGGLSFASVSAGYVHDCGVTTAGGAYCWDENYYGELGDGTTTNSTTPVPVTGGLSFASVSAGGDHTCGVTTAGAAYCWGMNTLGELGIGTSTGPEQCENGGSYACSTVPVAVAGGLTFQSLSVGGNGTCGVTTTSAPYCWGDNEYSLLGNPAGPEVCPDVAALGGDMSPYDLPCSRVPVALAGGLSLASLATGLLHYYACGLTPTGAGYCWGIANESTSGTSAPIAVPGGLSFRSVSVGWVTACGVTAGGVAYCWTPNSGPDKVAYQP